MKQLVLGSASPFKRELLQRLQLPFNSADPHIDESSLPNEQPKQLVKRLAESKARAVAENYTDAIIIGADQVATVADQMLEKPGNHHAAIEQLKLVSGKQVTFLTGLCVFNSSSQQLQLAIEEYEVIFRPLTASQIENYLQRDKPYNCAGSFKAERLGIALFEELKGHDPTALIGLPLIRLVAMLENEGIMVI